MSEEIEAIKYMMTNIDIQKRMLKKIKNDRKIKDNIYDYIRHLLREYSRYYLSLKRMLDNRTRKLESASNLVINLVSTITNNTKKFESNMDILLFFKEACKINIMDLNRVMETYKIKSKSVQNIIVKLIRFEEENLDMIDLYIQEQ